MDFSFSAEDGLFAGTVRQFALRELRPAYAERERPDYPISELLAAMAKLDLLGLRVPAAYGGIDASCVTVGIASEECARGDYNASSVIVSNILSTEIIANHGSPRVKDQWLPDIASGRAHVALALTEPHCGSDVSALSAKAERQGDEYVLSGEKSSISQVDAEAAIVFARGKPLVEARGISAFLVPLHLPGVGTSRFTDLGMTLSRRGAIHLDNVRIPADHLIGAEGRAFHLVMNQFDYSRAVIGLQCIGTAQQSVDETIEYVKTRHAFGQALARFEGVSFPIVEALTRLEAARLLCYKVLWLRDNGSLHTKEAAMAKLLAPKIAYEVIHQMLLLHGHSGYGDDFPHAQRLRDVIGHEIGDGTAEIMKIVIAREAIGREFRPY